MTRAMAPTPRPTYLSFHLAKTKGDEPQPLRLRLGHYAKVVQNCRGRVPRG